MKTIKMSYRGFCFEINPSDICTEMHKRIGTSSLPFGFSKVQEVCFEPTVIHAKGSIAGADAERKAYELSCLFRCRGSAYLFSPTFEPMKCFFAKFKITARADKNAFDYEVTFVEDSKCKKRFKEFDYTLALDGENYYDVSNRTGTPLDRLVEINSPSDLFSLEEGDRIWLK